MSLSKTPAISPNGPCDFRLIWTIGFSGKRFLSDEEKVSRAIKEALRDLLKKAEAAGARLTAISSLARGADILFAEACEELGISWRYLVPFAWDDFLQKDFATDQRGMALTDEERAILRARAERLRRISFGEAPAREADESNKDVPNVFPDPAVVTQGVVTSDPESLDSAYQDCSYRTVDESDVMVFVLRDDEFSRGSRCVRESPGFPTGRVESRHETDRALRGGGAASVHSFERGRCRSMGRQKGAQRSTVRQAQAARGLVHRSSRHSHGGRGAELEPAAAHGQVGEIDHTRANVRLGIYATPGGRSSASANNHTIWTFLNSGTPSGRNFSSPHYARPSLPSTIFHGGSFCWLSSRSPSPASSSGPG